MSDNQKEMLVVKYNEANGIVVVKGKSTNLTSLQKYTKLAEKVKSHLESHGKLTCYLCYEEIGVTTLMFLYDFVDTLQEAHENGRVVTVFWVVDKKDYLLVEAGKDLKTVVDFNFKITLV